MGSVLSVIQRGDQIQAEVQGSSELPYRVTIGKDNDQLTAICTCPYDYDGWCKHIVATALTCNHEANSIEKRPTLPQLLDKLNHIQTQRLVQELVEEHPELIDEIDGYVNAIASPTPVSKTTFAPRKQTTVNTAQIKAKVRQIFRDAVDSCESGYDYADETVNEELLSLIGDAVEYCEQDDGNNAVSTLEAITDACVSDWDEIGDYGMDNSEVVPVLNEAWCEAVLSIELTPEERTDIQINLETWQDEWNADFSLAITFGRASLNAALQQGWDYPSLFLVKNYFD